MIPLPDALTDRRSFLGRVAALAAAAPAIWRSHGRSDVAGRDVPSGPSNMDDRRYWLDVLTRIADPVLKNLANGRLRERMPVETAPGATDDRRAYSHLEAFGRLLAGMAPWFALSPDDSAEGKLREQYGELARRGISVGTDPHSPDCFNFSRGGQPLVDAAFLAHGVVRAPHVLWDPLDDQTKRNLVAALVATRAIDPPHSNWLMFAAMVETALSLMGERWDRERVDYALRSHEAWYKGDGVYGDGPPFHWDYYNSYVIQPMLLDVLRVVGSSTAAWKTREPEIVRRARRYAAIQERLISPEGTFPPIGRSLAYRFGAFQLLGQVALRHELPDGVSPAQVRSAMSAVIRRMIEAPGTFDRDGWLTIGFSGHQPAIGEGYISTGSTYLCVAGLVPLGLAPDDEFWTAPAAEWTSRRIWSGANVKPDHAIV